jgi:TolA-binding protein
MGKTHRAVLVPIVAGVLIGTPLVAKVNTQAAQIGNEQQHSQTLQVDLKKRETELTNLRVVQSATDTRLSQKATEIDQLRQRVDQLQKDLQAKTAQVASVQVQPKAVVTPLPSQPKVSTHRVTVGVTGNCESYRSTVAAYFPASQVNSALLAMRRESSCNPNAVSPSGDYGLMQIHFAAHSKKVGGNVKALFDPQTNVKVAAQVYKESGGWGPWTTMN